jgi:O-antigen/teichoic acid export membrane protein
VIRSLVEKKWWRLLFKFLSGQASLQALNVFSGLVLLRWLSKEEYAKFTFVMAFYTTTNMLVDAGFTTTITSLVGDRYHDKFILGKYVSSAKYYRTLLFAFLVPFSAVLFLILSSRQSWPFTEQILVMASIALTIYGQGIFSIYASPLQMHQTLGDFYRPQLITSSLRLVINLILYFIGILSGFFAFATQTVSIYLNANFIRRKGKQFVIESNKPDLVVRREMFSYLSPQFPQIVFYALQGQIVYLAITYFGEVNDIANIGALSRLQQIFSLFAPFLFVVIQPIVARTQSNKLMKLFLILLFTISGVILIILFSGFFFPELYLLILGDKYNQLGGEVFTVLLSGCITTLGSLFYVFQISRKWIFLWGNVLYIVAMSALIVIYISVVGITDLHSAVLFNLYQSCVLAVVYLIILFYGFIKWAEF